MQRYSQAKPALHLAGKVAVVRYFVTRQGQVLGCGTLVGQPSTQQYTQSQYHGCRAAKAPPHATTGQAAAHDTQLRIGETDGLQQVQTNTQQ